MQQWKAIAVAVAPVVLVVLLWRILWPVKQIEDRDLTEDDKALLARLSRLGLLNAHQDMLWWVWLPSTALGLGFLWWFAHKR